SSHTDTETDWQNSTTATDPTTGLPIPDASNTIYDDIDLDNDGLPGYIKKWLLTNPLVSDNPITIVGLPELFKLEPEIQKPNIRGNLIVPRFHFTWKRVVAAQLEKGVFAEVDADGGRLAAFSVADY